MSENIQKVKTTFKVNGLNYTQVWRDDKNAVVEVSGPDGMIWGYEFHKLRIRKEEVYRGKPYPDRELYCNNEHFGMYAWFYPSKDSLMQKHPLAFI